MEKEKEISNREVLAVKVLRVGENEEVGDSGIRVKRERGRKKDEKRGGGKSGLGFVPGLSARKRMATQPP
jgi:hypothetical protein